MQFSTLSIALAVLAAAPHAIIAAPATPNGVVPVASPPAEGEFRNATAGHDATHGPQIERNLEARQTYNAKGWNWGDRRAPCRGKDATYEPSVERVVGLSTYLIGDSRNCGREVHIENQGVYQTAQVVGVCQQCGQNDLGLSPALMKQFTKGQPQNINIKWYFGPPVHSPEEQAPHPDW